MILRLFFISFILFLFSACSIIEPYKFDIPQGNELDQAKLDQLKIGMTPSQVIFLLGSPSIKNPFDTDRWDYAYYLTDSKLKVNKRLITLTYTDGKLASIDEKYHDKAQN